jgi:hypothetical protein
MTDQSTPATDGTGTDHDEAKARLATAASSFMTTILRRPAGNATAMAPVRTDESSTSRGSYMGAVCRAITCRKCSRPTWAGCGRHVESVLGHVPADERCQCNESAAPEGVVDKVRRFLRR